MCEELVERMNRDKETNKRAAKLITVGYRFNEKDHNSKSLPIETYCDANKLADHIIKQVFLKIKFDPIVNLSIAASKFVDDCDDPANNTSKLETYFTKINKNDFDNSIETFNSDNRLKSKRIKNNQTINKTMTEFLKRNTSDAKSEQQKDCDFTLIEGNNDLNIELKVCEEENGYSEIDEKSRKRGFFYRKALEMEEELELL